MATGDPSARPPTRPDGHRTGRELLVLAAIVVGVGLVLWFVAGDVWRAFFPAPETVAR